MFHIIIWLIIGCLVMVPDGKMVSKAAYFLCWFMLMVVLIERII